MTARFPLARRTRAAARRFRPSVLALEGRDLPSTLTVTNLLDSGAGSLRAEIAAAASGDTINFGASVRGTIALTSGELLLSKNLTLTGPGADLLTVSGNHASRVFEVAADKTVALCGLTIADGSVTATGTTATGGGILNAGTLTLTRCTVAGNAAFGQGAYISAGPVLIDGIALGGGIASSGALTLSSCTVSGNTASGQGAYIFLHSGSVGTNGIGYGGGVFSTGALTLSSCTFDNNTAYGATLLPNGSGTGCGGGVYSASTLTIIGSTFAGNTAYSGSDVIGIAEGGGVYGVGAVVATDSTFAGNPAEGPGRAFISGGGVHVEGTATLTSCTVAGNSARIIASSVSQDGGGVSTAAGATTTLRNTIVAGNPAMAGTPAPADLIGPFASQGYNLIGVSPSGHTGWLASDLTGTPAAPLDPKLGIPQNNGGTTPTMLVLAGSPAIAAGDPALTGTADQRGLARVNPPSIGAVQFKALQTFTVTTTADSGTGSLRDALRRALGGDTIVFAPGLSGGTIAITSGELQIPHSVTIQGPGAGSLSVSGNGTSRVFEVFAGAQVTVSGLTVTGGYVTTILAYGGGILNHGVLTLSDCAVSGNAVASANPNGQSFGGGIYTDGDLSGATLTLTGCSIDGNLAYATGGGASATGVANGGGLYSRGGPMTLSGCDVSGNYAYADGGGLRPAYGGGLTFDGALGLPDPVSGTTTIVNRGRLTMTLCTVTNNGASGSPGADGTGGGVHVYAALATLTNCTVSGNAAATTGGGLSLFAASVSITGCTIAYNYAAGSGGGVSAEGGHYLEVHAGGTLLLNCTLAYNYAGADGGGANAEAMMDFIRCTVAYNYAADGGGGICSAHFYGEEPGLRDTLVADNGAAGSGSDCFGPIYSWGHNLIGITDGSVAMSAFSSSWDPTDLTGTAASPLDPRLGDLADNGGPTQTIALLPGSPAIGAGDPSLVAGSTDQRGMTRSAHPSIGAYEF